MPAEQDEPLDEPALETRRLHLQNFSELGPPDLVYVRKQYQPVVGKYTTRGYYHFVRGVDVSSPANVSAYIRDVIASGLDSANWFAVGGWIIVGVSYRTWNAISKKDMAIDLDIPGGVKESMFNLEGERISNLTGDLWKEAFVCATARNIMNYGEAPHYPCLRVVDGLHMAQEKHFLNCAKDTVKRWHLAGPALEGNQPVTAATSLIAAAIRELFFSNSRYKDAIRFFESLDDKECLIHVSDAYFAMEDFDAAITTIELAVKAVPRYSPAYEQKARILLRRCDFRGALEAAKKAVDLCHENSAARIVLGEIYVAMGEYEAAMRELNSASMPEPSLNLYLGKLVRNRKNVTNPSSVGANGSHLVSFMTKRRKQERSQSVHGRDPMLEELPGRLLTESEKATYSVMVKMLDIVGWERFLSIRGDVFVMQSDMEKKGGRGVDGSSDPPSEATNGERGDIGDENGIVERGQSPDAEASDNDSNHASEVDGKRVCKPWLDYLVNVLYEDLRAMAVWKGEEGSPSEQQDNDEVSSPADAADVESGAAPGVRSVQEIASSTSRPAVDWLRRGHLGERLEKTEKAKAAFQVCVKVSERGRTIGMTALLHLMAIYAKEGNIRRTLTCADKLWTFLEPVWERDSKERQVRLCKPIQNCINTLVAKCGLRKVQDSLYDSPGFKVNLSRVRSYLLDSVALKVHGFDM